MMKRMVGMDEMPRPVLTAICGWLVFGMLTACKPKQAARSSESKPQISTNSALQAELDRAGDLALEQDPTKRPLILSQPANDRRQWALQALQRGYQDTGRTNAFWDEQVRRALEAFSDFTRGSITNRPALEKALGAVPSGCDDPMIQYMHVRYRTEKQAKETTALDFSRAHDALFRSQHHPVFKFMAGLRAVESARAADKDTQRNLRIDWTTCSLEDLTRDTNAPIEEIFEAARMWVEHSHAKGWIEYILGDLEPIMKQNWGQTEQWFRFRGRAEIRWAWGDRGGGYADAVSDTGWAGFKDHLEKADGYLTKAWGMNSNIAETAYLMMRVELGQGQGRRRMETWFNRAMTLETNFYDAASLMSFYLEPRWYGSEATALSFAHSCVVSKNWGGKVPLVLADLHRSLAKYYNLSNSPAYWHRPQVWRDVKSSYEKFFTLNADAGGWRHNYAKDAYDCGQYAIFLEQAKLFPYGTNEVFFGGAQKFNEMIATAATASRGQSP